MVPRTPAPARSRAARLAPLLLCLTACIGVAPVRSAQPAASRGHAVNASPNTRDMVTSRARAQAYVQEIGLAHGRDAWREKGALRFDVEAFLGGQGFRGRCWIEPGSGRVRMELDGGVLCVWDGEEAWVSPSAQALPSARFHLRTIPYLLTLPFKLDDPGTRLYVQNPRRLDEELYSTARLTFEAGVGDTPDDWFLIFSDRHEHRVEGLAYIATYFTSAFRAEQDPHAVLFDNFVRIGGVSLPRSFKLYRWNEEQGAHGDPVGHVRMRGMGFVDPEPGTFARPPQSEASPLNRTSRH